MFVQIIIPPDGPTNASEFLLANLSTIQHSVPPPALKSVCLYACDCPNILDAQTIVKLRSEVMFYLISFFSLSIIRIDFAGG